MVAFTRRATFLVPLLLAGPPDAAPVPSAMPGGYAVPTPVPTVTLDFPLRACGVGGLCTEIDLGRGVRVRAVVDSGSPHLTVPAGGGCSDYDGCADELAPAGDATVAGFGTQRDRGMMRWANGEQFILRGSELNLALARTRLPATPAGGGVVVGVPDLALRRASGGFFLGLILSSNDKEHPTLLSQLTLPLPPQRLALPSVLTSSVLLSSVALVGAGGAIAQQQPPQQQLQSTAAVLLSPSPRRGVPVASFRVDAPGRVLTLSSAPLLRAGADAVPLIDLRAFGARVRHYAAYVSALEIDGCSVPLHRMKRPLVVLLDTGLSSAVVSSQLANDAKGAGGGWGLAQALGRSPEEWLTLRVQMRTEQGRTLTLQAGSDFGTPLYCTTIDDWAMLPQRPAPPDLTPPRRWNRLSRLAGGRPTRTQADVEHPHILAVGASFLGNGVLTVDADAGRAWYAAAQRDVNNFANSAWYAR